MLVIAPLRPAYRVWPKEQEKWEDFKDLRVQVLHGPKKNKLLEVEADVYVVNLEGLPWLIAHPLFKKIFKGAVLCVDESSKFKSYKSKRFKLLRKVLSVFKRRWILTGSPSPKSLDDLWSQIFILDMGAALGPFVSQYHMRWFQQVGFGGYSWAPRDHEAEDEIYEAIAPLVLRMSEKDYLKLPKLLSDIEDPIIIDLPPAARKIYDQMESLMFAQIGRGEVNAANAAVATMKCSQIANGGIYKDNIPGEKAVQGPKRPWTLMHDAKTEAAADLIDEIGGKPAIITYDYHHDLSRLQKVFPKGRIIGSGVSMKETGVIEDAWNAGKVDQLLVNAQSVAHGLNLQSGGWGVIWHSITWSWEDYDQLFRRLYRSGRKMPVFVKHIVARDTVDEVKLEVLKARSRKQGQLFDALKAYGKRKGLY
jgi:hypothetical protein